MRAQLRPVGLLHGLQRLRHPCAGEFDELAAQHEASEACMGELQAGVLALFQEMLQADEDGADAPGSSRDGWAPSVPPLTTAAAWGEH